MNNDIDLEERRKKIEKFMEKNPSPSSSEVDSTIKNDIKIKEINKKPEIKKEKDSLKSFSNYKNDDRKSFSLDEISDHKNNSRKFLILFIVLLFISLVLVTYMNNAKVTDSVSGSVSFKKISDISLFKTDDLVKEIDLLEQELKNKDIKMEKLKNEKVKLEQQLALIEGQKNELLKYSRRIKKTIDKRQKNIQTKKSTTKSISKIWKIIGIENENQVIINMVDTDRSIYVNIGDNLIDVGKIFSIKKVNNKWIVIGSMKNIVE